MPLQGSIAIPIYTQWEMEAQKDVPNCSTYYEFRAHNPYILCHPSEK